MEVNEWKSVAATGRRGRVLPSSYQAPQQISTEGECAGGGGRSSRTLPPLPPVRLMMTVERFRSRTVHASRSVHHIRAGLGHPPPWQPPLPRTAQHSIPRRARRRMAPRSAPSQWGHTGRGCHRTALPPWQQVRNRRGRQAAEVRVKVLVRVAVSVDFGQHHKLKVIYERHRRTAPPVQPLLEQLTQLILGCLPRQRLRLGKQVQVGAAPTPNPTTATATATARRR